MLNGWGDQFFYAFANTTHKEIPTKIIDYSILNLHKFRTAYQYNISKGTEPKEKHNHDDSSSFYVFSLYDYRDCITYSTLLNKKVKRQRSPEEIMKIINDYYDSSTQRTK